MPEALQEEQLQARGMLGDVQHTTIGPVQMIQSPYGPALKAVLPRRAPPLLGEHTRELLREQLGLAGDEIEALLESGAVSEHQG